MADSGPFITPLDTAIVVAPDTANKPGLLAGADFGELGADPAAVADRVVVYAKDDAGTSQLFARSDDGTVHQITPPAGAVTLDNAYDGAGAGAGRTITVDAGAVELDNRQTAGEILDINVGAPTTLSGVLTGVRVDVETNVTSSGFLTIGLDVFVRQTTDRVLNANNGNAVLWGDGSLSLGNAIQSTRLSVTGASTLAGNVAITGGGTFSIGGTTIFQADTDITATLVPSADATFSFGGAGRRFANMRAVIGRWDDAVVMQERATVAVGAVAAQGVYWVRNDTPNVPIFTDDAGTDHNLLATAGNTLDGAYDEGGAGAGRTITVDSGAVELDNRQTTGTVLDLNVGGLITLTGALTGIAVDLSTNVTPSGNTITAVSVTLPSATDIVLTANTTRLFQDGDAVFGATAMAGTERLRVVGTTRLEGDTDVQTGVFQIGSTTVFEADRDVAINLIPNADNTLDLGSASRRWANVFVGPGSVDIIATLGDANPVAELGNATLSFGAGGVTAVDVVLSRSGADVLSLADGDTMSLRTALELRQVTANYTVTWNDPAVARALTIEDPGGNDTFAYLAATQTLSGKTLTTPTIGDFTNATHTHQNAAGGGQLDIVAATTGTLTIARGGTGQTTATAAFDALSPLTTKGDIVVFDGINNVRLPVGTDGQVLSANSATGTGLEWAAAGGGAPTNAQYLVLVADATLTDERVFDPTTGLTAVDGGAGGNYTVTVDLSTGVAGGQSAIGGTAAGDSLTLVGTTNALPGEVVFEPSQGTVRVRVTEDQIHPEEDGTYDLGLPSKRFNTLYSTTLNTGDIVMASQDGSARYRLVEYPDRIEIRDEIQGRVGRMMIEWED